VIFEPQVPEDFDAFWAEAVEEAKAEPLDYRRSLGNDFDYPGFTVQTLSFRGMHGAELHGWIAFEQGAKRAPAFLWIPPYGRESLLPNAYGTRRGFTSLSFNFHGHEAFYQEKYEPSRGYFGQGAESPETWIFRTMIQNAYIAARVLQAQPEADEDRLAAMGMSQGGGMSIWLGALCPLIRCVCADMPFLGGLSHVLQRQAYRYPLKELTDYADHIPLGMERIMNTISYFDTIHFATRCQKPTLVSAGTKDPSVRVDQAQSIFEALPGEKTLHIYEWGHDWHPDMVDNNRLWMLQHLGNGA
jgi:cephalosporin-C deacetylase